MKTMTIEEAAKKLKVDESEVKSMCKGGSLDVANTPDSLPCVTEQSVYEFLGEEYVEPVEKPKRRGRQPNVLSYTVAASALRMKIDDVVQMAFDDVLEEWHFPGLEETGVTQRSVDAFIKSSPSAKEEYEHKDNFDMSEERELNEEKETLSQIIDPEKDKQAKHIAEEAGLISLEPTSPQFKNIEEIMEYEEKAFAEFEKKKALKNADTKEMITMSKKDFEAHVSISAMHTELGVYRSLKSFERRA